MTVIKCSRKKLCNHILAVRGSEGVAFYLLCVCVCLCVFVCVCVCVCVYVCVCLCILDDIV